MKQLFLSLAIIAALGINTSVHAQKNDHWLDAFKNINQEVLVNSEAYTRLGESIETIGHRHTGSPNGTRAEQYVFDLLTGYGFSDVKFQPFEVEGWIRESLSLKIGPEGELVPIKAVAFALTPPSADLQGELVDLGNGLESDYAADPERAKGKIVLAALNLLPNSPEGTKNEHRSVKTALAKKYGAKAVILFNRVEGGVLTTGTASVTGKVIDFPAINIGLEDGRALKEMLEQTKLYVDFQMKNQTGPMTARNVIARLEGSEYPDEKIVVGGHLDSWDLSPGAVDNGLGSFSVVDMARTFAALDIKPKRTIEFVLFMGEEQGLLGSRAYVDAALDDGSIDEIQFMLNFDMTNDPTNFYSTLESSRDIMESVSEHIRTIDTTFKKDFSARAGLYSDHQPFMLQGIPTGGAGGGKLSREALNCYHADCDDFHHVYQSGMTNTVRYSSMLIYALSDADELGVSRLSDEETKTLLQEANLEEALRIGGYWRWD